MKFYRLYIVLNVRTVLEYVRYVHVLMHMLALSIVFFLSSLPCTAPLIYLYLSINHIVPISLSIQPSLCTSSTFSCLLQ